jgi:hypothetical protein
MLARNCLQLWAETLRGRPARNHRFSCAGVGRISASTGMSSRADISGATRADTTPASIFRARKEAGVLGSAFDVREYLRQAKDLAPGMADKTVLPHAACRADSGEGGGHQAPQRGRPQIRRRCGRHGVLTVSAHGPGHGHARQPAAPVTTQETTALGDCHFFCPPINRATRSTSATVRTARQTERPTSTCVHCLATASRTEGQHALLLAWAPWSI